MMRHSALAFLCLLLLSRPAYALGAEPLGILQLSPYLRAQATVRASVNGQTGTFLFDTGQGVSSFSPAFAQKVGCKPWGRVTGFRMSGERLDSPHCDNITFQIDGVPLAAPLVSILDIMAILGPDVPPIDGSLALDIFAGRAITIVPRTSIVLESAETLETRVADARELRIRIVRDAEGAALAVDAGVHTPEGTAWMELDNGNGGSLVVADHIASLLGIPTELSTPQPFTFYLENGIAVSGTTRTRDLIMDGNIGAQFLNHWNLTLDLARGRCWMSPYRGPDR